MTDYKFGEKVGPNLIGKGPRPFHLSKSAERQALGKCVPHAHPWTEVCERHHWDRIVLVVRWGARSAWECAECGAGAHVEDPSNERAERQACLA